MSFTLFQFGSVKPTGPIAKTAMRRSFWFLSQQFVLERADDESRKQFQGEKKGFEENMTLEAHLSVSVFTR